MRHCKECGHTGDDKEFFHMDEAAVGKELVEVLECPQCGSEQIVNVDEDNPPNGTVRNVREFTYRQLKAVLNTLTDEQLEANVTVKDIPGDEYYGVCGFGFEEEDDVLDKGHPFIRFATSYNEKEQTCTECGKLLVKNAETGLMDCVCGLSYEEVGAD